MEVFFFKILAHLRFVGAAMTSLSSVLTKLENDPSLNDYETLNKFLKDENSFISTELHSAGETFEQLLKTIQRDVNTRSNKEKEKWFVDLTVNF